MLCMLCIVPTVVRIYIPNLSGPNYRITTAKYRISFRLPMTQFIATFGGDLGWHVVATNQPRTGSQCNTYDHYTTYILDNNSIVPWPDGWTVPVGLHWTTGPFLSDCTGRRNRPCRIALDDWTVPVGLHWTTGPSLSDCTGRLDRPYRIAPDDWTVPVALQRTLWLPKQRHSAEISHSLLGGRNLS